MEAAYLGLFEEVGKGPRMGWLAPRSSDSNRRSSKELTARRCCPSDDLADGGPAQRFAVPRSGGDSNRRSALAFSALEKDSRSSRFGQNFLEDRSENNSLIAFSAVNPLKFRVFAEARNHKEDRRFESPSLQQRGSANGCAGPASARSSLRPKRRAVSSFEDCRLESLDLGASHP